MSNWWQQRNHHPPEDAVDLSRWALVPYRGVTAVAVAPVPAAKPKPVLDEGLCGAAVEGWVEFDGGEELKVRVDDECDCNLWFVICDCDLDSDDDDWCDGWRDVMIGGEFHGGEFDGWMMIIICCKKPDEMVNLMVNLMVVMVVDDWC